MSWDQRFDPAIPLPKGKSLATLREAGAYIAKLPKADQHAEAWQTAAHCLIEAAEKRGPVMFARIGMMKALNRHVEKAVDPSRKDTHWGRRTLARDR